MRIKNLTDKDLDCKCGMIKRIGLTKSVKRFSKDRTDNFKRRWGCLNCGDLFLLKDTKKGRKWVKLKCKN